MDQRINIIHLSDLQFGEPNRIKEKRDEEKETTIRRFANKISSSISENLKNKQAGTSIMIVTGDIANTSVEDEYEEAIIFFEELIKNLNLTKDKVVLIHGNHDINWKICEKVYNNHKGDPKQIKEIHQKDKYYKQFYDKFYSPLKIPRFNIDSPSNLRNFPELKTIIFAVNSCSGVTVKETQGFINEHNLRELIKQAEKIDPNHESTWIACWHHNVIQRVENDLDYVENAREIIHILAQNYIDIILHGHEHIGMSQIYGFPDSKYGGIVSILGCGSAGLDFKKRPHGIPNQYSLIEINNGWISNITYRLHQLSLYISDWIIKSEKKESFPLLSSSFWPRDRASFMKRMAIEIGRAKDSIYFIAESLHGDDYIEHESKQIESALSGKKLREYELISTNGTLQLKGFLKQRALGVNLFIDPQYARRAFRYTIFDKSRVLLHIRPSGMDTSVIGYTIESPELAKLLLEDFKNAKKRAQTYEEHYYSKLVNQNQRVEDWVKETYINEEEGIIFSNDLNAYKKNREPFIRNLNDNWKEVWKNMSKYIIPSTTRLPWEIYPFVAGKNKIIEVGCGKGQDLIPFSYLCKEGAIGIDINSEIIEEINYSLDQLTKQQRPNVQFKCISIDEFNEKADVFLLKAFLTVIPGKINRINILKHIFSLINEEGILIIYDFYKNLNNEIYKRRYETHKIFGGDDGDFLVQLPDQTHFIAHHLDETELRSFEEIGFKEIYRQTTEEKSINGNDLIGICLIYKKVKGL